MKETGIWQISAAGTVNDGRIRETERKGQDAKKRSGYKEKIEDGRVWPTE